MELKLDLPSTIDDELKQLWLNTAGNAFKEIVQQQQTKRYLNQQEAAKYLHLSVNEFKRYSNIPRVMLNNVVRFDKQDLDEFYKQHKI